MTGTVGKVGREKGKRDYERGSGRGREEERDSEGQGKK